jgi:hypothetical protein
MQRRAASRGLNVRYASTAVARGCAPGLRWARCAPNFFPWGRAAALRNRALPWLPLLAALEPPDAHRVAMARTPRISAIRSLGNLSRHL